MSYHWFFSMSTGLMKTLTVAQGTKRRMIDHVVDVESKLGLATTQYKDNAKYWDSSNRNFSNIEDELLCKTVEEHNDVVRRFYNQLQEWSKTPAQNGEELSPKDASEFWHGLELLAVPTEKWTREYYTARMKSLYDVMRGRESEGVTFEEKLLTPRQAAQVINIFSGFLDNHDCRLDVPKNRDYLASSYDGGYDWCENCGSVTPEDADSCAKRKCPIRAERGL